ncbi:M3 family oligoendopeptidase [Candidatus Sumerlaeota bacterium]|nr:M3 family oligoendopeptidase [Candidatus Sumerlaeales bacterium]NLD62138.1 M3 family oligoendopeptidase [Candidatus Sumerlaeota bacterium]
MTLKPSVLKTQFPRKWISQKLDCGDWEQIAPLFEQLLARPLLTAGQLEQWIEDVSELFAALDQESALRQINMTCHTDDPELEKLYVDFVTNIMPKIEPEQIKLARYYLASPARFQLPQERYKVLDRNYVCDVELYREENIDLFVRDELSGQQYQKISGEMTAMFDGETRTMPQLAKVLEETDRTRRRAAWEAMIERRLKDCDAIDELFDEQIRLRHQMAYNAGYDSFIDFRFKQYHRFDYTPDDCLKFHSAVEQVVMPIYRAMLRRRREDLAVAELAPWDLRVDPKGRPPLRPFNNSEELIAGCRKIFGAVDKRFVPEFDILVKNDLLDLESRKGKAPGGYQCTLEEARLPFIFMNAAGRNTDVYTLLHEGGHAFHALATRTEPLVSYRSAPIEFCEVASMGMELMASERMDAFYSPENAARARRERLAEVIEILPWIARIDAFQMWIYTHPNHTHKQRCDQWLELEERFGTGVNYPSFPKWKEYTWQAQLHLFTCALYYIEYGIAELGALQLWSRFRKNPEDAVALYYSALGMGGSKPLPELFEAAGIQFAMDKETMEPLIEAVAGELKK